MKNFLLPSLCVLFFLENEVSGEFPTLEDVLLEDLVPDKGSSKCSNDGNSTQFSFDFHSFNASHWAQPNDARENLVFLAQMSHNDDDFNRSWTVRIGHGGNIYSLFGAYGEAIPPQTLEKSPWIDEVTQTVAVDIDQLNFIHQAGTYQNDELFMPPPFYSPNVATSCFGNTCRFASWAQQAHVPTVFKSKLLCIHQYRDCGNGVLEYTQNLMNMGWKETVGNNLRYLNVPWAGVRTSTLKEVLMSNKDGTMKEPDFPLQKFSDNLNIPNLADTGGYTTFAQHLANPPGDHFVERPCAVAQEQKWKMTCTDDDIVNKNYVRLPIVIQANNTCKYLQHASNNQGGYVVQLQWHDPAINFPYIPGCRLCDSDYGMKFTNERTGKWIHVSDIVWWSRHGYTFFKSPNATDTEINQIFIAGDKIQIVYNEGPVLPFDDSLAISYIHGIDEEYDDVANQEWMWLPTRIRYGVAGRDFTVFTVNARVELTAGKIYSNRQYLISDRLASIEKQANDWVDETYSNMIYASDLSGRKLVVYSNGDSSTFGIGYASAKGDNDTSCTNGIARCIGKTTPQIDLKAYFYIVCGNSTYFGPDLYAFSPNRKESGSESTKEPIRSYVCDNQNTRPSWKLLGYFRNESGCFELEKSKYDNNFCTTSNQPSSPPSASPYTPSTEPISTPPIFFSKPTHSQPTLKPSHVPSLLQNESLSTGFNCTSNSQCQSKNCAADSIKKTRVCSELPKSGGFSSSAEHHEKSWIIDCFS